MKVEHDEVWVQAERQRAAEAAAETEAAARAEATRLVLEKQLQQEANLQQVTLCPCAGQCPCPSCCPCCSPTLALTPALVNGLASDLVSALRLVYALALALVSALALVLAPFSNWLCCSTCFLPWHAAAYAITPRLIHLSWVTQHICVLNRDCSTAMACQPYAVPSTLARFVPCRVDHASIMAASV